MYIEQMYTQCLAEAAYYIESQGEAAIIDPIREIDSYLEKAKQRGAKIKYVFETHFHADFVSGHIDLAAKTGAKIIYGPGAETNYEVYNAHNGEEFALGNVKIKALHTPGHTLESTCFLLLDEQGQQHSVFTGDTLFVGDVGRPDLLTGTVSKEDLAGMLFDSLQNQIKPLADAVVVYPAHGAGSACGKNIGKETSSTIGLQKQLNYALKETNKQKFINLITEGLTAPPPYFFKDAQINQQGYENIDQVLLRNLNPLDPAAFKKQFAPGVLLLDTRKPAEFEKSFIKGAINIGLNGSFAVWVGTLIDIQTPLLLITEEGKEEESIIRLARVGFENVKGYLKGGMQSWVKAGEPLDTIASISAPLFAERILAEQPFVMDVRNSTEYDSGHVKDAIHISLAELKSHLKELDKKENYLIHCASGYRSTIAASMLKRNGFDHVFNVEGGFDRIKGTNAPLANKMR